MLIHKDILKDNVVCCQTVVDPSLTEDPAKDPQYTEPAVDAARAQKDEVGKCRVPSIPRKCSCIFIAIPIFPK